MGFNVSTLTDYVNEQNLPLLKKATLSTPTQGLINVMTGVKGTSALNIIDSTPVIQAGGCGWSPSGDTAFTQRQITVNPLKVEMALCPQDLESKWMNYQVRNGGVENPLPFEQEITESIAVKIAEENEKGLWQETSKYKGLLYHVDRDATEVSVTGVTGITNIVDTMYLAIPVEVLPKAVMFVGFDFFRSYVIALTTANLYHYNPKDDATGFMIPGTNTKIVPVSGLNNQDYVICADPMNLVYGVDFTSDAESFDLFYSKDNDEWRVRVRYSLGTQIAFPNEVVFCNLTV